MTTDDGLTTEQWVERVKASTIGKLLDALCAPEREAGRLDEDRMLLLMHALAYQVELTTQARIRQVDERESRH
jgi:hypothetical protein